MTEGISITGKKKTLIFINVIISCVAGAMLSTALSTALTPISREFDISLTTVQWLTSGYTLAMGMVMPLTAFLMNRVKTKRLYISAILLFLIGLVFCMISPSFFGLMAGRIFQACASGIIMSMGQVIILTVSSPENRGTTMGIFGLSISFGPVIAPTLAGILIDTVGWRMIFVIVLAVELVSLIFSLVAFEDILPTDKIKLDKPSFILSIFAFGGLTLGIGNIGSYSFASTMVLLPLLVGLGTLVLFIYRQLHMEKPLLELRTMKNRSFAVAVISSMILYMALMAITVLIPMYIQTIRGLSATISGLVVLPGSLVTALCSLISGRIYDKIGIQKLFIAGSAMLLVGCVCMSTVSMTTPIGLIVFYNMLRNVATGCMATPLITWGVSSLRTELAPHGTALMNTFRTISGAVGTATFVGIMTSIAANSAERFGENASVHGYDTAFVIMSVLALILLVFAFVFVKKDRKPVAAQDGCLSGK